MIKQATYPQYSLQEKQEQVLAGNAVSLPCSWCGHENSPLKMLEMGIESEMVAYVCDPCIDGLRQHADAAFARLPLHERIPVYARMAWVHFRCSEVARCISRTRYALCFSASRLNERHNPYARIHILELVLRHYTELFCAGSVEEMLQELKALGFHVEALPSYVNLNHSTFAAETPEETFQVFQDLGYQVEGGK